MEISIIIELKYFVNLIVRREPLKKMMGSLEWWKRTMDAWKNGGVTEVTGVTGVTGVSW